MSERLPSVMDPENSAAAVEIFDVIPQASDTVMVEQTPIDIPLAVTEIAPQPEKPSFEQNVAAVMEYVGDRVFTYKQHSGTAAEMAAMCPMAKMAFMRGPEFAISFLEKFDGTPPDPEKKEEPKPDEVKKDLAEPKKKPVVENQKTEQATVLEVVTKAEKKAVEAKSAEAAETGRKAPITVAMVAQVAIAAAKKEVSELNHKVVDVIAVKTKEEQSSSIIVPEDTRDVQTKDEQKGKHTISETAKNNQPPLPLLVAVKHEEAKVMPRVGDEETQALDAKVEIESMQPMTTADTESESIVFDVEPIANTMEDTEKSEATELPVSTATEPELLAAIEESEILDITDTLPEMVELVPEHNNEPDELIELGDEQEMVYEYETVIDATQQVDVAETADLNSYAEDEKQDLFNDMIVDRPVVEPTAPAVIAENQDDKESEQIPADVLTQIIEEVTERAEHGNQSEIEKRLMMIVRNIEVLKWARTGEECKDAVDELKKNLEALFRVQGYAEDAERLASELLNEYHLRTIDETMNATLKNVRSMRSHSQKLMAIRHLSIGRHVVRLLFGANQDHANMAAGV